MIKKWNRFECEKRTKRIEWRLPEDWSTTRLRLIVWLRIHTHETETSRGDPTTQHPETNTIPSATRSRLKLVLFVTSLFFILKFYTVYLFKDWRSTRMNRISHKILILKKHPFQILKFFFRSYFLFFSFCRSTQKKKISVLPTKSKLLLLTLWYTNEKTAAISQSGAPTWGRGE